MEVREWGLNVVLSNTLSSSIPFSLVMSLMIGQIRLIAALTD